MKHKIFIFSVVSAVLLICALLISVRKADTVCASCDIYDQTYNYHLVCLGDVSQCKFINPDGAVITCTGNKASATPVIQ